MLQFQAITLFPELFEGFRSQGLISRAIEEKHIALATIALRDFAVNKHGQVDDTPYGGGSGMVLRPEPAIAAIKKAKALDPKAKVVLTSPRGLPFNQTLAQELADSCSKDNSGLIFICPRYEGVDQRVIEEHIDLEISIGDYVLMGGEIPAMAVIESISRLLPEVLGNPESHADESFSSALLEYPQYTKPAEHNGRSVPDVLLSGNHAEINAWRREKAIETTLDRRPDLFKTSKPRLAPLSVVLVHYPVVDKTGRIVTSSITNIDLHDIARSVTTFNVDRFYIVHPVKALRLLAERIGEHWGTGYGSTYNPNRKQALDRMKIVPDLDDVLMDVEQQYGSLPKIIVTSAKTAANTVSYDKMRGILQTDDDPHLLLLGTGWGLADEIMDRADYRLAPINGPADYNHLSVRAAAAIMLDRLFGS